ncbi:hypothetical protein LOTGIDRAFT_157850 [Lottia gigantea]|uniref:C-type lectin domain-containing protein n=1 Tax=Lottia gigantea TaxID=225164 RepID=V4A9B0_LOTGI|nr:hypothetical protein LOTGIDRAFT_157850 [Lottia gigantea]ESP00574.1 hypothetical protein LOTGIDRAFT_157850 [Lottia gigantea]
MYKVSKLNCILLGILLKVSCVYSEDCMDSVYMKIQYTTKLIDSYIDIKNKVSSAYECLKLCRNRATCKSVGIETSSMDCYLYAGRVYAGLRGTIKSDIIYYWLLEHECPLHLGYSEDPTSKICTKYYPTEVIWSLAQETCEGEGGMLLMVDNLDSRRVATDYVTSGVLKEWTFLGSKRNLEDPADWKWFNGVPVNTSWIILDSNEEPEEPDCMTLKVTDKDVNPMVLQSHGCFFTEGFICQVPTKQNYLPTLSPTVIR